MSRPIRMLSPSFPDHSAAGPQGSTPPAFWPLRFASALAIGVSFFAALSGCGGSSSRDAALVHGPRHIDVELPQLEIHADNVDRLASCPPVGGVTQGWIPEIPTWSAQGTSTTAASVGGSNHDGGGKADPASTPATSFALSSKGTGNDGESTAKDAGASPNPDNQREIAVAKRSDDPDNGPTPTERAIRDTLAPFRSCYRRGLLHEPTQNGHVAVVVRVGPDGRVAQAETYGACELSREVIGCMMQVGKRLRFDPPAQGSATIIIPAVFAPRSGIVRQTPASHDDYAAAATVALESARPALHECEQRERRAVRSQQAWATFAFEVDSKGHAGAQTASPFGGNTELLKCAGDALQQIAFPIPDGGSATVRVRVEFNPRAISSE